MIIETSPENYQVWIRSSRNLTMKEKQYWLKKMHSDPGAHAHVGRDAVRQVVRAAVLEDVPANLCELHLNSFPSSHLRSLSAFMSSAQRSIVSAGTR